MSISDKEVEKQIFEAGENLLDPPSSLDELLSLLDKANQCLSEVEQSPPASMQKALSPLMKALVAAKLFKHSDEDVKVAVAACISEITRITAPDAPYNDDQMKEVFQLIVSTFEQLVDESSRSYSKRTSILETVAKVRSCVVMLDLECDALIIEMFRHFLKAIRDHHSESGVYTSMETIMNLVLEESEDISPQMLSPILEYARMDDEVPKISRELAEKVLSSCASKLKTYLREAVKLSGVSLDKYSNVVTSICDGTFNALEEDQVNAKDKEDNQGHSTGEAQVEDTEKAAEISTPEQTDAPKDESGKSEVSNGVAQIGQNDSPVNTDSTMKQDDTNDNNEPQQPDSLSNTDLDNTTDEKTGVELNIEKTENQPSSVEIVDSSKTSVMKEETDTGALVDNNKDVLSSPPHDSPVNADVSSENEKKTDLQALPSKTPADETANVDETSLQGQDNPEEIRSKKVVNQKKKENSEKEPKPSATKEVSDEPNTSEAKLTKKSGKKATSSSKAKPKRKEEKKSTSETKAKQSGKKAVETDIVQESSKPKEEKNKPGRGKGTDEESLHTSSGDNDKLAASSGKSASKAKKDVKQPLEETPNTNTKRKRSLDKGKASDLLRHDDNLVGSRIKVWWPMDRAYYNGVVDSYDSNKKRHLICYDDGDQEILNLKKQKFYFLDESESSQDEEADQTVHDEEVSTTPQKKKAKTDKEQTVTKQSKTNSSAKKGTGAGSSKSKAPSTSKSSKKSEDDKTESKPKETNKKKEEDSSEELSEEEEETPKPVSKPATTKSGSSSKSKKDVPKSGKSKDQVDASTTPKAPPPSKKKEETTSSSKPKSAAAPAKSSSTKGKTGKSSGKSSKAKTGSASAPSKAKESDDVESEPEEKTPKVAETTTTKGKSAGTSKSKSKSSKKRKR